MKKFYLAGWMVLSLLICSASGYASLVEQPKPNIVLFLVDDMGWQDTSVPFWDEMTDFNKRYHTPHMERLAAQGIKFTQAYATPVCSPTRISLMTGMNAARHRVTNWTLHKNASNDRKDDQLEFPLWNVNGLSPEKGIERTVYAKPLPQILNDHGYYTVHAGKAHFGAIGTPGENPLNLGFDVNIAGHAAGAPESYLGTENFGNGKKGKEVWAVPGLEHYHGDDIFLSEAITRDALKSLDDNVAHKPFFLYMSHYAVHTPIYGDPRFVQKYYAAGLDSTEAKYASMIEGMDKSLGDIMDYLEANDLDQNTIILFMSDNGGLSAHARGGEKHSHNRPLASGKGSMYEGGIREPMLVKYPFGKLQNVATDMPLIIEDFFATILEMAGITQVDWPQQVDGKSFLPFLSNLDLEYDRNRAFVWHYPNLWGGVGPGIGSTSAIRKGDFKLIYYHKTGEKELFNIKQDIGEHQDISTRHGDICDRLSEDLGSYLRSVNAQMPFFKSTGERVAWPDEL